MKRIAFLFVYLFGLLSIGHCQKQEKTYLAYNI